MLFSVSGYVWDGVGLVFACLFVVVVHFCFYVVVVVVFGLVCLLLLLFGDGRPDITVPVDWA